MADEATRYITAQNVINRAAVECGLQPSTDVYDSTDPAFQQLRYLLDTCGQDLVEVYDWEILRREESLDTDSQQVLTTGVHTGVFEVGETVTQGTASGIIESLVVDTSITINTVVITWATGTITGSTSEATATISSVGALTGDSDGQYDLPTDFGRMLDQTGWERTENVPMGGPLSPQQWSYVLGRGLLTDTLWATFRIMENTINILPQPVPDGLDIRYEYISRKWVQQADSDYADISQANDDVILFKPTMIVKLLRARYLEAKGFDTTKADANFLIAFEAATGGNKSAPVLNAGSRNASIRLLDFYNIPNTNYGA